MLFLFFAAKVAKKHELAKFFCLKNVKRNKKIARSDGFEPPSAVLETAKLTIVIRARFEPPIRIELTLHDYESCVLPLNYGG